MRFFAPYAPWAGLAGLHALRGAGMWPRCGWRRRRPPAARLRRDGEPPAGSRTARCAARDGAIFAANGRGLREARRAPRSRCGKRRRRRLVVGHELTPKWAVAPGAKVTERVGQRIREEAVASLDAQRQGVAVAILEPHARVAVHHAGRWETLRRASVTSRWPVAPWVPAYAAASWDAAQAPPAGRLRGGGVRRRAAARARRGRAVWELPQAASVTASRMIAPPSVPLRLISDIVGAPAVGWRKPAVIRGTAVAPGRTSMAAPAGRQGRGAFRSSISVAKRQKETRLHLHQRLVPFPTLAGHQRDQPHCSLLHFATFTAPSARGSAGLRRHPSPFDAAVFPSSRTRPFTAPVRPAADWSRRRAPRPGW